MTGESDTGNNASSALTVVVAAAPDLTVDRPNLFAQTIFPGDTFSISAAVRNIGDGSSPSTTLRWRLSTDTNITTSDQQIGTDSVPILAPFGVSVETISLTAPDTPGDYYYGATVDSVAGESDTGNNASEALTIVVAAATAPDLTIDAPTRSPTGNLTPGEQFRIKRRGTKFW